MIIIFSEKTDQSTKYIAEILESYNVSFRIIFEDDHLNYGKEYQNEYIKIGEEFCFFKNIKSVWFRRGKFLLPRKKFLINELTNYILENDFILQEYVNHKLEELNSIGSSKNIHINKLVVLDKAKKLGIQIPEYFLSEYINNEEQKYITKGLNGNTSFDFKNSRVVLPVTKLKKGNYSSGLSFFQKYIEKKYELRIFYLRGKFWSMAIFSQNDPKTKIDFRNYNKEKPNRMIPYLLPIEVEKKLDLLMKELSLNTGSIDMIVTPKNEFVFLEVNPVGQFGMVSYPCNYHLEKIIAENLIDERNH